ncbi:hypothetical protein [Micromonospora sp. CPCC 206061]|uniref:hypothetical protein n=1 Tax=Micromonospora sp. CPCC 206061 TaxID=3122410 RepID=UPI002FEF8913
MPPPTNEHNRATPGNPSSASPTSRAPAPSASSETLNTRVHTTAFAAATTDDSAGHRLDLPPSDNLTDHDTGTLAALLDRCPELHATHELVHSFAAMLTTRTGQKLTDWIIKAIDTGLPAISNHRRPQPGLPAQRHACGPPFSPPRDST